jgi:hypothetical protein
MAQAPVVRPDALDHAIKAFWKALMAEYPDRTTNDFQVQHAAIFKEACFYAANAWIAINPPSTLQDAATKKLRTALMGIAQSTHLADAAIDRNRLLSIIQQGDPAAMRMALREVLTSPAGDISSDTLTAGLDALAFYRSAFPSTPFSTTDEALKAEPAEASL